jgi:hypothetical protein
MEQTATEWLFEKLWNTDKDKFTWYAILKQAKEMEKEQMIGFHKWMLENDTSENAESYFHFSDNDMLNEYIKVQKL